MRVLLLNDYGTASGGAELQMLKIRSLLRERGHDVRLLTSDARLVDGFDVEAERSVAGRTDLGQAATQTLNPSAWNGLRRELDEFAPDVVHVRMFLWQLSPLILQRLAHVPVVYQAAVYKAVCPTGLKMLPDGSPCSFTPGRVCRRTGCVSTPTWISTMAQRGLVHHWRDRIDHTVALSHVMREIFEADGWRDVSVIGNGIDVGPMRRSTTPTPTVGYAGRLAPEKGVETLIDSFARAVDAHPVALGDAELIVAGTGPSESDLRDRAQRTRARIRFVGHLDRREMEDLFAGVWVQAVPSLWHEPFGNVTTEAMARGTAVVASDVGGQRDLVRSGETGFLVPPGDTDALSARLAEVLADRGTAERLGDTGRAVALRDHAWGPVVDRLIEAYERAATNHAVSAHGRRRAVPVTSSADEAER